jgi:hypothetical protein
MKPKERLAIPRQNPKELSGQSLPAVQETKMQGWLPDP